MTTKHRNIFSVILYNICKRNCVDMIDCYTCKYFDYSKNYFLELMNIKYIHFQSEFIIMFKEYGILL